MSKNLAYHPSLKIFNEYVVTYHIYILKHPFTNEIFYVGMTKMGLIGRLAGHINDYGTANKPKRAYIQDIIAQGSKPLIESVETIRGLCRIDWAYASEREYYWIQHYKALGCRLLNIVGIDGRRCLEYRDYLESIKAGKLNLNYYFCGRTLDGHGVYDENKMIADGFTLERYFSQAETIYQFVNRELELQKFYDELRQEIRAAEWPPVWVNMELLKSILPMPDWSPEFAVDIPPDEFLLDLEMEECDFAIDDWDEEDDFAEIDDYA